MPLRLTVSRGALGLELYESVAIGPLEVTRLGVTLPGLKFPVDLSGGVRVFRHRRGHFEHLELEMSLDALSKWLYPRLRETLGGLVRPVSVWPVDGGLGIGVIGKGGALAFEFLWAPVEADARFVLSRARGADLAGPALLHALHLVDTAIGKYVQRTGRIVVVPRLAAAVARTAMPQVGARAPAVDRACASPLRFEGDTLAVTFDTTLPPPGLSPDVTSALELAILARAADDALARGELDAAREGYVSALERAPRHPEISRVIAEIDLSHADLGEAALALLSESGSATAAGALGALLLARTGDRDGAAEALGRATRDEVYAPLTALHFIALSRLAGDARERLSALDAAVATSPGLPSARWERFEARVGIGDVEGALADAEHLEASVTGSRARHDVLTRAARRLMESGAEREAGRLYERALRYVPDDAEACAGLARALLESGRSDRAVALLERAIALGEASGAPAFDALVDLARVLSKNGDLPQAIARLREVRPPSSRVVEARALEGDLRAKLGDLSGATLAYGRMREAIELSPPSDVAAAVDHLRAAARFERATQDDPVAAERHLAIALRLAPRDRRVGEEYREVSARINARARRREDS